MKRDRRREEKIKIEEEEFAAYDRVRREQP
jgi:hypothetical protein